eukprot:TRINITY_DN1345_c0_g1_i2.p1 TRINITY_DN1345_c0_g1~~TRINITY_DN1345_c0_g1_i2.p1  ORF type:complete len:187 (+),score=52.73 TRINITY_DN1345_c0_g1_i2:376-936(+)
MVSLYQQITHKPSPPPTTITTANTTVTTATTIHLMTIIHPFTKGWDKHYGFQLYKSDPSGNYGGWKATSIGSGHQVAASILKSDYNDDLDLEKALVLAAKLLSKTMDSTQLGPDKCTFNLAQLTNATFSASLTSSSLLMSVLTFLLVEFATLTRKDSEVIFHSFGPEEIKKLLESFTEADLASKDK